ncbi:hypothetical protein JCM17380_52980 [Desulfosporosinus burensis]
MTPVYKVPHATYQNSVFNISDKTILTESSSSSTMTAPGCETLDDRSVYNHDTSFHALKSFFNKIKFIIFYIVKEWCN